MPTRPSKFGIPDIAPVVRRPDGTLAVRDPFTPSAYGAAKEAARVAKRRANRGAR